MKKTAKMSLALFMLASLLMLENQEMATAATATDKVAKASALPTVKQAPKQAISSSVSADRAIPASPAHSQQPVIERIYNQGLPVPSISERLIRDVMVGKPIEAAPPAGTEAFAPENAQAPPATGLVEEAVEKSAEKPVEKTIEGNQDSPQASTLTPDAISAPENTTNPETPNTNRETQEGADTPAN